MAKNLDDGPDGLNDDAWERAWAREVAKTRLRAAKLPAKQRQMIPVIKAPTGGKP